MSCVAYKCDVSLDLGGLISEPLAPLGQDLLLLPDVLKSLILRELHKVVSANLHHDFGKVLT